MSVLTEEYVKDVFHQIGKMSDHRALAVLTVAFLDECLGELLLARFVENTKLPNNLQFQGKVDLAKAIGLLAPQSHKRLSALNTIRNKLGHETKCDSFDNTVLDGPFNKGNLNFNGQAPTHSKAQLFLQAALMEAMTIRGDIQRTERLQPRKNSEVIYKSVP